MSALEFLAQKVLPLLLVAGLAVVLFFVTRALWLWYWRIGEIVALLREILWSLKRLEQAGKTKPPTS